jgi:glycosyltransferase involved in cell wall biosynthesis
MFRVVQGLADAGHSCTLALYDRHGGRASRHESVIRDAWPWLDAAVEDVRNSLTPSDVYIATSWESAHVLGVRGHMPGRRMYFVQDFEPFFYGRGSEYALSEDTYRFGFTCIAVGNMVAEILRERYGVECAVAEYGCDTGVYRATNTDERHGVVFYAKRDYPRRGFALGVLALREFHRRHPEQTIHVFGDPVHRLDFPVVHHGRLRPAQLARLYNECIAGLVFSFTNVSLVPSEMLACGVIPVLNDSRYARLDFPNPNAVWSQPSPAALAASLSAIVSDPDKAARSAVASASVSGGNWDKAKRAVVDAVEREVYG